MASLIFPSSLSNVIIAAGVAHLEPEWNFSISNGTIQLNLKWHNANTGNLITMPPKLQVNQSTTSQRMPTIPKMHNADRQTTHPAYASVGVPSQNNCYSASLRKSKFRSSPVHHTPPRFQRKTDNTPKEYNNRNDSPNCSPILNNHIVQISDIEVPFSNSDKYAENTTCNEFSDSDGHNTVSNEDNGDHAHTYNDEFENSSHSYSSIVHSDLSHDANEDDSDESDVGPFSENILDQNSNFDEEKVDTNTFLSRLFTSNDNLIEGSYEPISYASLRDNVDTSCEPISYASLPDKVDTDKTIPPLSKIDTSFESSCDAKYTTRVSKIDTSFESPCDVEDTTHVSQTKQTIHTKLISNNHVNSVSGSYNAECGSEKCDTIVSECVDTGICATTSTSDGNTGETNNERNEPRMLTKDESRESIDSWSQHITEYLCSDENFSRIIGREWKKSLYHSGVLTMTMMCLFLKL